MNLHCGILQCIPEDYIVLMKYNKSCLLINIKDPERNEWLLGVKEGEALLKFESDFIPALNNIFITIHSYQVIDVEEQKKWFSYIRACSEESIKSRIEKEKQGGIKMFDPNIEAMYEALKQASIDMHLPSMRPCETCKKMSAAIGFTYGCYAYQQRRRDELRGDKNV